MSDLIYFNFNTASFLREGDEGIAQIALHEEYVRGMEIDCDNSRTFFEKDGKRILNVEKEDDRWEIKVRDAKDNLYHDQFKVYLYGLRKLIDGWHSEVIKGGLFSSMESNHLIFDPEGELCYGSPHHMIHGFHTFKDVSYLMASNELAGKYAVYDKQGNSDYFGGPFDKLCLGDWPFREHGGRLYVLAYKEWNQESGEYYDIDGYKVYPNKAERMGELLDAAKELGLSRLLHETMTSIETSFDFHNGGIFEMCEAVNKMGLEILGRYDDSKMQKRELEAAFTMLRDKVKNDRDYFLDYVGYVGCVQ